MVLEAGRLGCARRGDRHRRRAVDPGPARAARRPAGGRRPAACALQGRRSSDFLAILNLWRYLREQQKRAVQQPVPPPLPGRVPALPARARVAGPRRSAAPGGQGRRRDRSTSGEAEPQAIHTALLAGLLSHIGLRDQARREYQGARGTRFGIFPGSALARRGPTWVMAAELVETSRLWGRTVARIEPGWAEGAGRAPRAADLRASRAGTRAAARWWPPSASRSTGCRSSPGARWPTVASTPCSRASCSSAARSSRATGRRATSSRPRTRALVDEAEELEHRARRRGIVAGDEARFAFFDARMPAEVVSGAALRPLVARRAPPAPRPAHVHRATCSSSRAPSRRARAFPPAWRQGDLRSGAQLPLRARAPRTTASPSTSRSPRSARCATPASTGSSPACASSSSPRSSARCPRTCAGALVPVPDVAAPVLEALTPRARAAARRARGRARALPRRARPARRVGPAAGCPRTCACASRSRTSTGAPLAAGHDLARLREEVRPRLRRRSTAARPELERSGLTAWTIGTLPRRVELPGTGVRGLSRARRRGRDGRRARARVAARRRPRRCAAGTRRLLALTVPSPLRYVQDRLGNQAQLALAAGAARHRARRARGRASPPRSTRSSSRPAGRRGTRPASRACATTWPATSPTRRGRWSARVVRILDRAREVAARASTA